MTSAEQAKERLLWCVSQRRNGGAWVQGEWRIREYVYGHRGPVIQERFDVLRWRYA